MMAGGVCDEKIADQVGMVELVSMPRTQTKMDQVAVDSGVFPEEA
jgi:hypothetical protein